MSYQQYGALSAYRPPQQRQQQQQWPQQPLRSAVMPSPQPVGYNGLSNPTPPTKPWQAYTSQPGGGGRSVMDKGYVPPSRYMVNQPQGMGGMGPMAPVPMARPPAPQQATFGPPAGGYQPGMMYATGQQPSVQQLQSDRDRAFQAFGQERDRMQQQALPAPMAPVPMSSMPPAPAGYRLPGNFNDLPPQQQFEISNESALSRISPGARQQYDSLRAGARPEWRDEMAMMEDQSIPFQERLARRREMSKGMSLGQLEDRRSLGTAMFDAKNPQLAGISPEAWADVAAQSMKQRSPELYEYMRISGRLRPDQLEDGDTLGYKSPYADRPNEDGGAMHAGIASRKWSTRGFDGRRAIDVDYTPEYLAQLTRPGGGSSRRGR